MDTKTKSVPEDSIKKHKECLDCPLCKMFSDDIFDQDGDLVRNEYGEDHTTSYNDFCFHCPLFGRWLMQFSL